MLQPIGTLIRSYFLDAERDFGNRHRGKGQFRIMADKPSQYGFVWCLRNHVNIEENQSSGPV